MIKYKIWMMTVLLVFSAGFSVLAEASWDFPLAANLVDGKGGYLVLTNRSSLLQSDFEPHDLVDLKLRATNRGYQLRHAAAAALTDMFETAEEEAGLKLYVKSAYRSFQTQSSMYQNRLERNGKDDNVVAYPGSSDHQTGLGVDILNYDWTKREGMTTAFGETKEAQWMEKNAARFGFILRYMPEKQEITGIIYEPWHFRYVGTDAAQFIMEKRISLEEFDVSLKEAIADFELRGGDFAALCRELNALPAPKILAQEGEEGESEVSLFYQKNP